MTFLKNHKIIIGIIGIALVLRLIGISYGLPFFFVGDEQSQLGAALVMLKTQTIIPGFSPEDFQLLYYPPVMSYLYLLVLIPVLVIYMFTQGFDPSMLGEQIVLNPTVPWVAGRVLIVLMSLVSIYMVYVLAGRIFSKRVGYLAAFFLATSFLYLSLSHFTRHWVPTTFFEILVMLGSWNIFQYGRKKDYLWSAILVSMSFGVGFIGIVSGFFPVIAHFARARSWKALGQKNFWWFGGALTILVIGIIALYPQRFLEISQGTDISLTDSKSLTAFLGSFGFHLKTIFLADPVIFILGLIGVGFGFVYKKSVTGLFLIYSILYIGCLYFVIHDEPRYISFLYPGFVILAGLTADFFWQRLKGPRFASISATVLLLLSLGYPVAVSAKFAWLLHKTDTRITTRDWVEDNLPQEAKILSFIRPEVFIPSKQAVLLQEQIDPPSLRTRERTLKILPDDQYPRSFDVLSVSKFDPARIQLQQAITEFDPNYIIIQYWNSEDYLQVSGQYKFWTMNLIQTFGTGLGHGSQDFTGNFDISSATVFQMSGLGPVVEIYKSRELGGK